ncbi:MAG: RNA polymerase factor sigma-54 [Candidatus Calescibacterium sp.]|jgi:RNA polymerase sigma-54 factor|nr:RNA polymerase factor sigma-54 [Candidatus Calescibacterium sp.]
MIKFQLEQKPTLKLKITPSIIIQLKLITLPIHELEEQIKKEAEENPFLEYDTEEPEEYQESYPELYSGWTPVPNFSRNEELEELVGRSVENISAHASLDEKVIPQIYTKFSDQIEILIAEKIFWSLDEKGYLSKTIEDIKKELEQEGISVSEDQIENVRKRFMELDPPGIGSKNAEEYFLFILSKFLAQEELEKIKKELEKLKNNINERTDKNKSISGNVDLNLSELISSINIRLPQSISLPLFPTFEFLRNEVFSPPRKVDLHVFKYNGETYIIPEKTIRVRLSDWQKEAWYKNAKKSLEEGKRKILDEMLQRAKNYVEGLKKREDLVMKVAKAIFSYQDEFLETGEIEKIKPLTLEDLEKMCGISKSTIDRAIINKYVRTPYGIFELKRFLSRGFSKGEIKVSREAVMNEIKNMIENEDPQNPLSDSQIAEKLKEKFGIDISRRTVVKYRKILGIPQIEERRKKIRSP